jgi:hypothetical protein
VTGDGRHPPPIIADWCFSPILEAALSVSRPTHFLCNDESRWVLCHPVDVRRFSKKNTEHSSTGELPRWQSLRGYFFERDCSSDPTTVTGLLAKPLWDTRFLEGATTQVVLRKKMHLLRTRCLTSLGTALIRTPWITG